MQGVNLKRFADEATIFDLDLLLINEYKLPKVNYLHFIETIEDKQVNGVKTISGSGSDFDWQFFYNGVKVDLKVISKASNQYKHEIFPHLMTVVYGGSDYKVTSIPSILHYKSKYAIKPGGGRRKHYDDIMEMMGKGKMHEDKAEVSRREDVSILKENYSKPFMTVNVVKTNNKFIAFAEVESGLILTQSESEDALWESFREALKQWKAYEIIKNKKSYEDNIWRKTNRQYY